MLRLVLVFFRLVTFVGSGSLHPFVTLIFRVEERIPRHFEAIPTISSLFSLRLPLQHFEAHSPNELLVFPRKVPRLHVMEDSGVEVFDRSPGGVGGVLVHFRHVTYHQVPGILVIFL